jgi:hypothetical protein
MRPCGNVNTGPERATNLAVGALDAVRLPDSGPSGVADAFAVCVLIDSNGGVNNSIRVSCRVTVSGQVQKLNT